MSDIDFNKQLDKIRSSFKLNLRESEKGIRIDNLYQGLLFQHVFKRPEPLVAMTGWSIAPEFAWWLYEYVKEKKPRKIIEFGSGTSTLVVSAAIRDAGLDSKILSYESDYEYCEKTLKLLKLCSLEDYASVIHAPLKEYIIEGDCYNWYSVDFDGLDVFSGQTGVDLILVDGPPKSTNYHARYPAYPLLRKYLNESSVIIMDDADREEEKEILKRWGEKVNFPTMLKIDDMRHAPTIFGSFDNKFNRQESEESFLSNIREVLIEGGSSGLLSPIDEKFIYYLSERVHSIHENKLGLLKLEIQKYSERFKELDKNLSSKIQQYEILERELHVVNKARAKDLKNLENSEKEKSDLIKKIEDEELFKDLIESRFQSIKLYEDEISRLNLLSLSSSSKLQSLEDERRDLERQIDIIDSDNKLLEEEVASNKALILDLKSKESKLSEITKRFNHIEKKLSDASSELEIRSFERNKLNDELNFIKKSSDELENKNQQVVFESLMVKYQNNLLLIKDKYLRHSLSFQLGNAIVSQLKSPAGIFKFPIAIFRVVRRYRLNRGKVDYLVRKKRQIELDINRLEKNSLSKLNRLGVNKKSPSKKMVEGWGASADLCQRVLARKSNKSLVSTILRTSSVQARELLAYLASDGRYSLKEIIRAVEGYRNPAVNIQSIDLLRQLDLSNLSDLARVLAYQQLHADDRLNSYTIFNYIFTEHGRKFLSKADVGVYLILSFDFGSFDVISKSLSNRLVDAKLSKFISLDLLNPAFGGSEEIWLKEFNFLYAEYGLSPIYLKNTVEGNNVFSRVVAENTSVASSGLSVAVVITAWCPGYDLLQAVQSIVKQTYKNIHIIIVNDASPVEYSDFFVACQEMDSRVQVIHQLFNQGTYVARNTAIAATQADLVTFLDSDDWSHPQRLERQVAQFSKTEIIASHAWAYSLTEDMRFCRPGRPIFHSNASSLMFRRAPVLDKIGFMDSVRKGADTEYALRIKLVFGEESFADLEEPLALIRLGSESLSRNEFRAGWSHPSRRIYKNSYSYWHQQIKDGKSSPYIGLNDARVFPAPLRFKINKELSINNYDVIFVGDWHSYGGPQKSMIEEILALYENGKRLAICTLEPFRFMRQSVPEICLAIKELIHKGVVDHVCLEDKLTAGLVFLRYPPILQYIPKTVSNWYIKNVRIVANQAPNEKDGSDIRYHVTDCIENAKLLFGCNPLWVPQGPLIRDALLPLLPQDLLETVNNPGILNVDEWFKRREHWVSDKPVIGRYSRDNILKFSSTALTLKLAYMADENVYVKIMGGTKSVPEILKSETPKNWELYDYGTFNVKEFLYGIDFFVYFDNEAILEAFGRSILEAIASGVVVILPEHFKPVFGGAAVYCTEDKVSDVVLKFYSDKNKYNSQVERAYECLRDNFSYASFNAYISNVLN